MFYKVKYDKIISIHSKHVRITMDCQPINASRINSLWELQKLYKREIGEDEPDGAGKDRLAEAIKTGRILFFGAAGASACPTDDRYYF